MSRIAGFISNMGLIINLDRISDVKFGFSLFFPGYSFVYGFIANLSPTSSFSLVVVLDFDDGREMVIWMIKVPVKGEEKIKRCDEREVIVRVLSEGAVEDGRNTERSVSDV